MGHSEGTQQGKFCAVRAEKCTLHKNEYQKNCTPPPVGWETYSFLQGSKEKVVKKFEAHHVLCIACVTQFIGLDEGKAGIKEIVKETDWCVNDKPNMLAMPLWGHTIKHYCSDFANLSSGNLNSQLASGAAFVASLPPPFQNIPQHDYDHNSGKGYKQEIDGRLKLLAQQVAKKADEDHKAAVGELKTQLGTLSGYFKGELIRRGSTRSGGTHAAWQMGSNDPDSKWYEPFSMANDGCADVRPFPAAGGTSKVLNKLRALLEALGRWGST